MASNVILSINFCQEVTKQTKYMNTSHEQSASNVRIMGRSCLSVCLSNYFISETTDRVSIGIATGEMLMEFYFESYWLNTGLVPTLHKAQIELQRFYQKRFIVENICKFCMIYNFNPIKTFQTLYYVVIIYQSTTKNKF
jgi:hypothetical protein